MISRVLFKKEFKSNYKLLLIFLAICLMYIGVVVKMFDPKMIEAIESLTQSMGPLLKAFGMDYIGSNLTEFCVNYLFGFILLLVPLIYIIMLANKLVAKYVDDGSMTYLLSSPNKRKKIITTQAFQSITSCIIISLFITASIIFFSELFFPGQLDIKAMLLVNVGLFFTFIFFSGMCFMISCIFSDIKWSYIFSIMLTMGFFLIQMLGQVSDKITFLKYLTPLSLFKPSQIIENSDKLIWTLILFAGGILFYIIGAMVFNRKDLHI